MELAGRKNQWEWSPQKAEIMSVKREGRRKNFIANDQKEV